jgi:hypothetical protein
MAFSIQIPRSSLDNLNKIVREQAAATQTVKLEAQKVATVMFRRAKNAMLREFETHNITQELRSGNRAVNISNTLGGYGNLFSFLGFENGDDPTTDLEILLRGVEIRPTVFRNNIYYFSVNLPTRSEIEEITEMPWERGNSWAYGVEKGISNLSYYVYKRWNAGRSQTGFMIPKLAYEYSEEQFQPQPYISQILSNFRDRINNASTIR